MQTRRTRSGERTSEPGFNGYKVIVVVVTGLLTLFFLLLTIMPIILFETLDDMSWELKTFATSYRPLVALIGLVLFLLPGLRLELHAPGTWSAGPGQGPPHQETGTARSQAGRGRAAHCYGD